MTKTLIELNMIENSYSKENIRQVLESVAPIENYFINKSDGILGGGLIMFFDKKGRLFLDQHSDDEFNDACVEYLTEIGAPVFESDEEVILYKREWQKEKSSI